jgi:predicted O-methyltransferase YrrM
MPNILDDAVEEYLNELIPPRDAVLAEMERLAERDRIPIVGAVVARLLALATEMTGARRIFEMGSAIGYSTIWLARAAGPRGRVYYTDGDPDNARRAEGYFRRAGVAARIKMRVGDAVELLRREKGPFDIIFCDVDKHQYPEAFRIALPRLKHGGLLIADNALWRGRVAQQADTPSTRGVQEFNRLIYASRQLDSVIVPLRDGVAICRKR